MASLKRGGLASMWALLLLAASPSLVTAEVPLNLCSDFNTADMSRNISIYQTNGLCSDFCRADYAYAITQEQSCWCSDYTPDTDNQVSMSECDLDCPAFPVEKCGGRGLWGYVELNGHLPSGTKGSDDTSSTTAGPSTTTSTTTTTTMTSVTETETAQTTETTSSEETSTTSTTPSTISSSSSTNENTATEPTMFESTFTTDGGVIRTVTITPDPTNSSGEGGNAENSNNGSGGDGGLGTGGIVGIVVGVIGGVLVIAGIVLFWFLKRRKRTQEEGYQDDPSVRGSSSDRVNPEMAASAGSSGSAAHNSNRNSTLQIDPRMDPFKQGLYARNGSHESIDTLRDDRDYSRRILRATNPDQPSAS